MSDPTTEIPVAAKPARRAASSSGVKAPTKTVAKTLAKKVVKRTADTAAKPSSQTSAKRVTPGPKPSSGSGKSPTQKPAVASPAPKPAKIKLVRDSFTMPEQDHALISQLKKRALGGAHAAKKSEVLRAALHLLASLSDDELLVQLRAVPAVKTGRPRSRK